MGGIAAEICPFSGLLYHPSLGWLRVLSLQLNSQAAEFGQHPSKNLLILLHPTQKHKSLHPNWVWQYFKTEVADKISSNVFQENCVPGGSVPCLKILGVDKKGLTKSMSNYLTKCHRLESN